jgi:hypothetical protein
MVGDAIDDPRRIAQLLASELTGLETGRLADVAVVDADRDAEPSDEGTTAYRVEYAGDPLGAVVLYPDGVVVELADGLGVKQSRITVETGAASKRAVDEVRDVLASLDDGAR